MKVQSEMWSKGEFFFGLAWQQDERSLELHFIKPILKLKFRPAKEI